MPLIEVTELRKRYGTRVAVDGISLRVERGEIFGILGSNGAGKTTPVDSCGAAAADGGGISVLDSIPRRTERRRLQQGSAHSCRGPRCPEAAGGEAFRAVRRPYATASMSTAL